MKRGFLGFSSMGIVIVSLAFVTIGSIHAASDPMITVDPKVSGGAPTESFSVNILIANVTNLYAWQFNLTYNPSILEAVSVVEGSFLKQFRTSVMATPNINNTGGWVFAGAAFLNWEEAGASGSGVLATVSFRVIAGGTSFLHLSSETGLRTYDGNLPVPMTYEAVDGVFAYPRDLAVTGLVASSSSVPAGESVTLNATIMNKGIVDETNFNATVYRNSTVIGTKTNIALNSGASTSVVFVWDTTGVAAGNYVMRAEVSLVPGENNTGNNVFSDGIATIELVHDVAVTGVVVSPASVPSGGQVSINVTVLNKGSATESFSVTVTYASTVVGTQNVANLAPGASETLTFMWETKDVAAGSYTLAATASTVSGETETVDNVFSNVSVQITNPPFTLPIEWLIIIVAVIVALVAGGIFLYMRRRSKKA